MQYKFPLSINTVHDSRYFLTASDNGAVWHSRHVVWGRVSPPVSTIYQQLIEKHKDNLLRANRIGSFANHSSALRQLLRTLGMHESSPVGAELTSDFDMVIDRHLAALDVKSETKSDRRRMLDEWRQSFAEMAGALGAITRGNECRSAKAPEAVRTAFHQRLVQAYKETGLTPKGAAVLAGVSTSAVGRWSRGALPNVRSNETLEKLEKVLLIPTGELMELLSESAKENSVAYPNAYRQRVAATQKLEYRLKESELISNFLTQWREFFDYKTCAQPEKLERTDKGRWKLNPIAQATIPPNIINSRGNQVSASADVFWSYMSRFFGFLQLPYEKGGFGQNAGAVQSLAWFAVRPAMEAHLEFMKMRAEGTQNGSHRAFCGYVSMLTHPETGYLTQHPELATTLPAEYIHADGWQAMCKYAYKTAKAWKRDSNEFSRDSSEPLAYLLSQEYALTPVFEAMQKLREEASFEAKGSKMEAILRRDEIILGLLTSNPLRVKNIITLTFYADNTGSIYKSATGQWRLRISGTDFKNALRVSSEKYDVPIAPWLQPLFDDYVQHFRPRLAAKRDSGYFFLSSRDGSRFDELDARVRDVTRRLIPETGGIGPHAFRALVATDWLKHHPNDFMTVAQLLNDTIEVVIKHYAKLKTEDAFSRYSEYVEKTRKKLNFNSDKKIEG